MTLPSICEHQACYTVDGFPCIIPFTYKNVEYKHCSSQDLFKPWCPTGTIVKKGWFCQLFWGITVVNFFCYSISRVYSTDRCMLRNHYKILGFDSSGNISMWGFCLEDCPFEPPAPSCLSPPPVPSFAAFNSKEVNFESSWFNIEAHEGQVYRISKTRTRLHRPEWFYDPANVTEEVEIFLTNNTGEFTDIYEIVPDGVVVNYTCPLGFVFNDSFSIYFEAECRNWTWIYDFDSASRCIRKYYF